MCMTEFRFRLSRSISQVREGVEGGRGGESRARLGNGDMAGIEEVGLETYFKDQRAVLSWVGNCLWEITKS